MKRLRVFLTICVVLGIDSLLFASPTNEWIKLYNEKKYSQLIEYKIDSSLNEKYAYLLTKSFMEVGNYTNSLTSLNQLKSLAPKELNDVVTYQALILYSKSQELDKLLVAVSEPLSTTENRFLIDFAFQIFIEKYQKYPNLPLLRQSLELQIRHLDNSRLGPDVLRLLISTYSKDHPRKTELLIKLWQIEDVYNLSAEEKQVEQIVKQRKDAFHNHILEHFNTQRSRKNYTYMADNIPGYLSTLSQSNSPSVPKLRELYFFAMVKKKKYTVLIQQLRSPESRKRLGLNLTEALIKEFDLWLRKRNSKNALAVLKVLQKSEVELDQDRLYLSLADFYFQQNQLNKSLVYLNKINLFSPSATNIEYVKWRMWKVYYTQKNRTQLGKLASWAKSHRFEDNEVGARFCYWSYKLKLYQLNSIEDCYERYPLTYYGLHSRNVNSGPQPYSSTKTVSLDKSGISSSKMRIYGFLELLYAIEENELADSLVRLQISESNKTELIALADLLLKAGRYYLVQLIVESNFRKNVEESISGRNLLLPYFYPKAFSKHTNPLAKKYGLPEILILSVMREESHFNPDVVSVAGAIGLMQLMPKTADFMGKKIGMKVKKEQLVNPGINLQLGSAYLNRLLKRYKGNLFHTLAAYNGGPTNVRRWLKKAKSKDSDDFVETITFRETQNYVRRVMRSFYIYQSLYGENTKFNLQYSYN